MPYSFAQLPHQMQFSHVFLFFFLRSLLSFSFPFLPFLGFDDALDAFGVHAIGGIIGGLATGFFATDQVATPFSYGEKSTKKQKCSELSAC
jgi:ammonia channel protein AmtB